MDYALTVAGCWHSSVHLVDVEVNHHGLLYPAIARLAELPDSKHPVVIHTPSAASAVACMVHAATQIQPPAVLQREA